MREGNVPSSFPTPFGGEGNGIFARRRSGNAARSLRSPVSHRPTPYARRNSHITIPMREKGTKGTKGVLARAVLRFFRSLPGKRQKGTEGTRIAETPISPIRDAVTVNPGEGNE